MKKKIKEFFKRVFIDSYASKETEDQKKARKLIESIIELPTTTKIMANNIFIYIANEELKTYITFNGISLSIIKDDNYVDILCDPIFAESIQKTIDEFLFNSIRKVENMMKDKKSDQIINIINSIKQ